MPNLTQYPTYDAAAQAFQASTQYRKIADPAAQLDAMHTLRDKYFEAHGIHKDIGPTDIVPPTPEKKGGEGELGAPTGPLTRAPDTILRGDPAPAKTPLGPEKPPEQPDLAGRVKAGAEGAIAPLDKYKAVSQNPLIPDPLSTLIHALPGDNIQAGIDAAMGISLLTGAGEVEGAGGLAYKALRALPSGVRGLGRFAYRLAIPTLGGVAGGATEGKTVRGGLTGTAEGVGGEVISGVTRGLFGITNKAIQKTDLKGVGNWLRERLPDFPDLRNIGDFRKLFLRGELEDTASEKLGKIESKIGRQLQPKGPTSTTRATVFAPTQQDVAQQEALASVSGTNGKTSFTLPQTSIVQDEGVPEEKIVLGDEKPKTVFAPKGPKEVAYQKVKDIQAELKAARDAIPKLKKSGSGLSAENAEISKRAADAEAKISEIQTRLKAAQAEARAITKGGGKQPIDLDAAVAESKRRAASGEGLPSKPTSYVPPKKAESPMLKIELPGPIADYKGMARRTPYEFAWDHFLDFHSEIEAKGWGLIGNPDPEKAELGKALRSSVFQMEHDAADALRAKVGDKAADEWLASRQQYRAARVLTQLFRSPNLVDASGSIAWDEIQRLVDAAGREGFYDDLKLAFGKDGADQFIDKLTRNAPNERDIPGRGILTTHSRVYANPMGGSKGLHMRIPFQVPIPTIRAGDVPFNLGRNRALSAMMVLGPERFVQMIDDMAHIGSAAQPKQ